MTTGLSGSREDSFTTLADDALEMRFSNESIRIFHKNLADFESALPVRSYDIPVHFHGDFDVKSQNAIQNMVNESFVNAEKHQLRLEHNSPEVSFYTRSRWEAESGKPLKRNSPLPAARLVRQDDKPVVELIIPEKITTSEDVIKTVRLLFSKLFGKLFFDEHVPAKTAFQSVRAQSNSIVFDLTEKARFIHYLEAFTPPLQKAFDMAAQALNIKGPKKRELGRKEFFNRLFRENAVVDEAAEKLINSAFQELLQSLKSDPNAFFDTVSQRFFAANPQTTILLPYDMQKFRLLSQSRQWTMFNALEERIQLIVSSMEELSECRAFFEMSGKSESSEMATLEAWKGTFSERIKTLKHRGFVKPFLLDNAKLTERQQQQRDQFPLWIWKYCKPDPGSGKQSMSAFVAKTTARYKNSVYQKLFEAAIRFYICLEALRSGETQAAADCPDFQRIKTILAWLELRKTTYIDMLYTCRIALQMGEIAASQTPGRQAALRNFEQGWSYFVSFAMIHQYFLDLKKRSRQATDRSGPFLTLIEKFVKDRIQSQPSFQISALLIEFYKRRQYKLSRVSELIRKESQILDFFILNQPDIFRDQSKSPTEKINQYAERLLEWQNKRDEQDILPEERKAVRAAEAH